MRKAYRQRREKSRGTKTEGGDPFFFSFLFFFVLRHCNRKDLRERERTKCSQCNIPDS